MSRGHAFKRALRRRGYQPLYRTGIRCPGCAGGHWIVGRFSAECANARCAVALPLAPPDSAALETDADIIPFRCPAAAPAPPTHMAGAEIRRASDAPAVQPLGTAGANDPEGR